jgi:hypothetical protein
VFELRASSLLAVPWVVLSSSIISAYVESDLCLGELCCTLLYRFGNVSQELPWPHLKDGFSWVEWENWGWVLGFLQYTLLRMLSLEPRMSSVLSELLQGLHC